MVDALLDRTGPPGMAAFRAGANAPAICVAAAFQPADAIGIVAAPADLSRALDYLAGYLVPSASPATRTIEAAIAGPDIRAWAAEVRAFKAPIARSRLAMARGRCGDLSWYTRYDGDALVDLTVLLPDRIVVATPADGAVPRHLALARAVRNAFSARWSVAGGAYLHAGCVVVGERGVLIIGDKFAGKTTLICELIARGARFTSNDRVFILPDGTVLGLPVSVNIRPATLTRYNCLAPWRGGAAENPHRIGMDVPDCDVSLAVGDFVTAFATAIRPAAPLYAVVRLVRAGSNSTSAVDLTRRDATRLLASNQFDGIDYSQPFWPFQACPSAVIERLVEEHVAIAREIRVGDDQVDAAAALIEQCVMVESASRTRGSGGRD